MNAENCGHAWSQNNSFMSLSHCVLLYYEKISIQSLMRLLTEWERGDGKKYELEESEKVCKMTCGGKVEGVWNIMVALHVSEISQDKGWHGL